MKIFKRVLRKKGGKVVSDREENVSVKGGAMTQEEYDLAFPPHLRGSISGCCDSALNPPDAGNNRRFIDNE